MCEFYIYNSYNHGEKNNQNKIASMLNIYRLYLYATHSKQYNNTDKAFSLD